MFWGKQQELPVILPELPSPKTKEEYIQLAEDTYEKALALAAEGENDGWTEIPFESTFGPNDIHLYDKKSDDDVNIIKVTGTIRCPLEELVEILNATDTTQRQRFEKDLISSEVIEEITHDPELIILRQRYAAPFPVTNREVVVFKATTKADKDTIVAYGQSINHDQCLSNNSFIRAVGMGATIFRRMEVENEEIVHITKLVRLDPKGMIPTWVVSQGKKKLAAGMCIVRQLIEVTLSEEITQRRVERIEREAAEKLTRNEELNQVSIQNAIEGPSTPQVAERKPTVIEERQNVGRPLRDDTDEDATDEESEQSDEFFDATEGAPGWVGNGLNNAELKVMLQHLQETLGRVEESMMTMEKRIGMLEKMVREESSKGGSAITLPAPKEYKSSEEEVQFTRLSWGSIAFLAAWPFVALALWELAKKRR